MDNLISTIEGINFVNLRQISDERGSVLHVLRSDSPDFLKFGECYISEIFPNAIKAWKMHKRQTQNIAVPAGRVKIVIFDPRVKSDTFKNIMEFTVGRPDSYFRITIPPDIWYGFQSVSENPALIVNCSDIPHEKSESTLLEYDTNLIPYKWNTDK